MSFVVSALAVSLIIFPRCKELVNTFLHLFYQANGEGGIWTLAPLLTTCTLSRGVPSASLGTSPRLLYNKQSIYQAFAFRRKRILSNSFQPATLPSGEDGIRTHVPLRTNGFQDRLVMTTSIPLHINCPHLNQRKSYITIIVPRCQAKILLFQTFLLSIQSLRTFLSSSPPCSFTYVI